MSEDGLGRRRVAREARDEGPEPDEAAGAEGEAARHDAVDEEEGARAPTADVVEAEAAAEAVAARAAGSAATAAAVGATASRGRTLALLGGGLGLTALGWLLLLALEPDQPPPTRDRGEPRVRIALVASAPELVVELAGTWRAEPDVGAPLLLESPGAVTLRPLGGGLEGLALAAASGAGFPGARALTLRPLDAVPGQPAPTFGLGKRRYRGWLTVRALSGEEGGGLRAINSVGIEDYLAGVLGHEMPIGWDDAALEAQAIAARTYALTNLAPAAEYDLEADERSQVYRGVIAEDARARGLVEATRGRVVAYEGELVVTYFHSTCGGDTVPAEWVFPWHRGKEAPALRGAGDCPCQPSKFYRWETEVELAGKELGVPLPLRAVEVEHWPRGGYVRRITLRGAQGEARELSGWDGRRLLGLRSYAYELELREGGEGLRARGRGWGHGVGLCQFGAQGRAKQGWSAEQILTHYYPGATVERLDY